MSDSADSVLTDAPSPAPGLPGSLDSLLRNWSGMRPFGQFYGPDGLQAPADPRHVFELRKNAATYSLHATDPAATFVPEADGEFIYVIKPDDPGRVYVAIDARSGPPAWRQYGVEGHTSFDGDSDALFAGEIVLREGRLVAWDNSSGHYRPSPEGRHANLLPVVRLLLPDSHYNMHRPPTLRLGSVDVPVADLMRMGAHLDGEAIWAVILRDGLDGAQRDLANRIQYESDKLVNIEGRYRDNQTVQILAETAFARRNALPIAIGEREAPWMARMNQYLDHMGKSMRRAAQQARSNLVTYAAGGKVVNHTGVGLQVFSLYNGLRALRHAVARGDSVEAAIQAAGLGAHGISLGAEAGMGGWARYLLRANAARLGALVPGAGLSGGARFAGTIGRGAGAVGVAFSAPFDIYSAVSSFNAAARTDGKQAQDHYVDGGLAVAGVVASLGLAAAAFAGLPAAGPIGVIAGLGLTVASGIYHSVRYVEDLDEYAGLTAGERFETGLASFLGARIPQHIEDRAAVGRARRVYVDAKRAQLQARLSERNWSYAVFGDAVIRPQAPLVKSRRLTSGRLGPSSTTVAVITQRPAIVIDNAADDRIDASCCLQGVANGVSGPATSVPTVLWAMGDGNDRLLGVQRQANVFSLRQGLKTVRGGDCDDVILLNARPASGSVFDGGDGNDTLVMAATQHGAALARIDVLLDDQGAAWDWDRSPDVYTFIDEAGKAQQLTKSGQRVSVGANAGHVEWDGGRSMIGSIENVITDRHASTRIVGNREDNVFVLNGVGDSVVGGGGNDVYCVNGGGSVDLHTGNGLNRIRVARTAQTVNVWAKEGQEHVAVDVDVGDVTAWISGADLEFRFHVAHADALAVESDRAPSGSAEGASVRVVFKQVFRRDDAGGLHTLRRSEDIWLMTRDGFTLAPVLASAAQAEGGQLRLVATDTRMADAASIDLLLQYASALPAPGLSSARNDLGSGQALPDFGTAIQTLSAPA